MYEERKVAEAMVGTNSMSLSFANMQEMYINNMERFAKIELQNWTAEEVTMELTRQVSELSKKVMLIEKYRALTGKAPDIDVHLDNETAGIIAQIMRLADCYNIDLEKAFVEAREDEDKYLKSRDV